MRQRKKWLILNPCFIVGIIIGIIIGAGAMIVVVSYRVDSYYERIVYLENIIQDKNAILEKLEKTSRPRSFVIRSIEVNLEFDGDDIDRANIEKSIKQKYITLLGKEVKNVDAELIVQVVDNRTFKIADKEYRLGVSKLIISDVLKLWVVVKPLI